MIDQNRDGFIDNEDLKDMLASLGKEKKNTKETPLLNRPYTKLMTFVNLTINNRTRTQ